MPESPDVLLVLCDTARADAFGPWGSPTATPAIDALARRGTTYLRATSTAPWTLPSTASIMTGARPTEHGVTATALRRTGTPDLEERDGRPEDAAAPTLVREVAGRWLPESAKAAGYRTFGVSCNPWVSRWIGFDRGFDRFVDVRPWNRAPEGTAQIAVRRALEMSGVRDHGGAEAFRTFAAWHAHADDAPRFAVVNLMEMHDPYDPPPRRHPVLGGCDLPRPRALAMLDRQARQKRWRAHPDLSYIETIRSLYYATARYEDELLRRFVERIEASGRPTIVVVVSDHGENLGEHGLFEHHSSLHETLLHVPLIIAGFGVDVEGGTTDAPVTTAGIAPALERALDGDVVALEAVPVAVSEYEGTVHRPQTVRREIQRHLDGGDDLVPALYFHPGVAIRVGDVKLEVTGDGRERWFDLARDPGEQSPSPTPPSSADVDAFRTEQRAWEQRRPDGQPAADADASLEVEDDVAEHLRMLGYIE